MNTTESLVGILLIIIVGICIDVFFSSLGVSVSGSFSAGILGCIFTFIKLAYLKQ